MRLLLFVVSALLGVWGQDIAMYNQTVGTAQASFSINVTAGVAKVWVEFTRNQALGWVALGFTNTPTMTGDGGSDIFMCNQAGTVDRHWVTSRSQQGFVATVNATNGNCSQVVNGGITTKTMTFTRFTNATAMQRPHTFGPSVILLAFGTFPRNQHGSPDILPLEINIAAPPGSPTGAPSSPTGAPTASTKSVIAGYPQGRVLLNDKMKLGWDLVGNPVTAVRFAIEATSFDYIALGFQNPDAAQRMTGDAVVAQGGPTPSIGAYTVTYSNTPVPSPSTYYTAGSASIVAGALRGEFTRTKAAPLNGSVALSNLEKVVVMLAYGNGFPATHIDRVQVELNLLTGAATLAAEATPAVAPKVTAIVILGVVAAIGFIFTIGLGHTGLGRFCFFRRVCKDSQFMGPRTPACFDLTVGQAFLLTLYFGLITLFSRLEFGQQTSLSFLKAMGWTSTLSIACASIPVSRHSILLYIFGMSFERAIIIHRVLGRTAVLIVLMHFVAVLLEPLYQPFNLSTPLVKPYNVDLSLGFWTFMCLLVMLVTSIPPIRRKFFELFYYTHHLFIAVWVMAILHNKALVHQLTLIVPFALWGIDRFFRFYRGRVRSHQLVSATIIADALRLEFKGDIQACCPPTSTESGSYAFINVPGVSWFQWHPFSISSRAGADNFTFHIKNMGVGTFTGHLHEYFAKNPSGAKVNIDGPYGRCAVRFEEYQSVLLFAGGVGVTPMAAILDDLYEKCKNGHKPAKLESVTFCWSVQTKDTIAWMEDLIKKIQANPSPVTGVTFNVQVFVTRSKEESPLFKAGRPKVPDVFESAARPKDGAGKEWQVGVLACGPEPMVVEVQKQAQIVGYDFHKEIFAF